MAKYSFQVFPKGDIDYRLSTNVTNLKKFIRDAVKNGGEIAAADSHTRHDMEQLYMDEAYDDEDFASLFGRKVFMSEKQRESVKSGRLRPLRKVVSGYKGNSNG